MSRTNLLQHRQIIEQSKNVHIFVSKRATVYTSGIVGEPKHQVVYFYSQLYQESLPLSFYSVLLFIACRSASNANFQLQFTSR